MQSANHRVFSLLSSKVHKQLPLTPRESEQLLNLITTSFRTHLDREHPLDLDEPSSDGKAAHKPLKRRGSVRRNGMPMSSHLFATQHIDSILTNPLFSTRKTDVKTPLQDPVGWFFGLAAIGDADITKASTCISILTMNSTSASSDSPKVDTQQQNPATRVASYLKSSGLDTSKEFFSNRPLIHNMAALLMKEESEVILWRWFASRPPQMSVPPDLSVYTQFQSSLLKDMIDWKLKHGFTINEAMSDFLQAQDVVRSQNHPQPSLVLRLAGHVLLKYIWEHPQSSCDSDLFDSLLASAEFWCGVWAERIQSSLWLHHPSRPSADMALAFITHPQKVSAIIERASEAQRRFLVNLYLGTARQLLADQRYADAHKVLQLTKDQFPSSVGFDTNPQPKPHITAVQERRTQEESRNLEMLDRLLPI